MKLRERAEAKSQVRCSLTNPGRAREATLWAAGIERCASLVSTIPEAEPLVYGRRQHRRWSLADKDHRRFRRGNSVGTQGLGL